MKKFIFIISILFIPFSTFIAQNQLVESNIKSTLAKVFDLSKKQDYSGLSEHLFNKNEIRAFNNANKSELKSVKRMSKKIKAYLDLSDSYEYESLASGKFENLPSAELKVNFKSGDQDLSISFIFVQKGNKIFLAKFK